MTARCGITNHQLVESFERVHKHLLRLGFTDHESTRGAACLTFALSGEFTREQAWEAADEIAAQAPQTTNTKGHDGHGK
jgi:hypothetical protein